MDGVPDRDVIVTNPVKVKERPKHKLKKAAQEKISGGDPPPVYMKHGSLFLFSPQNSFRRVVFMVVFDKKFEYLILLFILVSSAALAVDDPSVTPDSNLGQALLALDVSLNVVFFVEFAAKVIAMGLVLHPVGVVCVFLVCASSVPRLFLFLFLFPPHVFFSCCAPEMFRGPPMSAPPDRIFSDRFTPSRVCRPVV